MSDLEAIEAIRQLKARYCRFVDSQQWDALADLFTEDAEMHIAAPAVTQGRDPGPQIARGPSGIADFVARALRGATSAHQAFMPELELTGPDSAKGTWAMQDRIWFPEGAPVAELTGYGHYQEQYERGGDGRWRIKRLELTRIRVDRTE